KGRKRHVATDTLGLVLAVIVTAASVHDSTGGKRLLDELATSHPSVTKVWADGGYQNSVFQHGASRGIDVEVVKRSTAKGFQPQKKRWVIERTFGWLMQNRRLVRESKPSLSDHAPWSTGPWLTKPAVNSPENPHQPGESKPAIPTIQPEP
ncbi:transposase, partial [Streptomyces sp. NPDC051362]|uniref:transposase n=1 Tax=Streptomyces sp. NPDC051362 TaxID=3365651 RepID=UPI0037BC34F1